MYQYIIDIPVFLTAQLTLHRPNFQYRQSII